MFAQDLRANLDTTATIVAVARDHKVPTTLINLRIAGLCAYFGLPLSSRRQMGVVCRFSNGTMSRFRAKV
jgi:hypothetical protein